MIESLKKLIIPAVLVVCVVGGQKVKQEYDKLVADYRETRGKVHQLIEDSQQVAERIKSVLDSLKRVRSLEENSDEE